MSADSGQCPRVGLEVASNWEPQAYESEASWKADTTFRGASQSWTRCRVLSITEKSPFLLFGSSSPVAPCVVEALALRKPQAGGTHFWAHILPFKYQHRPRARAAQSLTATHPCSRMGRDRPLSPRADHPQDPGCGPDTGYSPFLGPSTLPSSHLPAVR